MRVSKSTSPRVTPRTSERRSPVANRTLASVKASSPSDAAAFNSACTSAAENAFARDRAGTGGLAPAHGFVGISRAFHRFFEGDVEHAEDERHGRAGEWAADAGVLAAAPATAPQGGEHVVDMRRRDRGERDIGKLAQGELYVFAVGQNRRRREFARFFRIGDKAGAQKTPIVSALGVGDAGALDQHFLFGLADIGGPPG